MECACIPCSYRFGEQLDILHAFGEAFTEDAGGSIVRRFTFNQPRTNTADTLENVIALLEVWAPHRLEREEVMNEASYDVDVVIDR